MSFWSTIVATDCVVPVALNIITFIVNDDAVVGTLTQTAILVGVVANENTLRAVVIPVAGVPVNV
jgi:hypothetical protein